MADMISLRLPRELREELERLSEGEDTDTSTLIRELLARGMRERKLERSLALYSKGKITLWKAARLAGVSLWEITDALKARRVELHYDVTDLYEDVADLRDE
jgi:predicted HTH domain antitoxin